MDLAEIVIKVDTRDLRSANDEIGAIGKTGKQTEQDVNKSANNMNNSFKGLTGTLKLVGGALASLGVVALGKSFSDTVTETERLKGSLVTVTGSTENAALAFDKLLGFASTTPFTLDQSITAFTRLSSLGLTPSERALNSYGNTAAAMGKDMMQMIEAVADASTGEFERLKEFGIRASKQADEVTFTFQGVATTVKMNSEEIQGYLLGIGETNFAGAMENQMSRLPGLFSNLSDQVTKFFLALGDAGGVSLLAGAVSALSGAIAMMTDNVDVLITTFEVLGVGIATYFGYAAVTAIIANIGKIRTAVMLLNTTIVRMPIGAVVAAVAAGSVLIIKHWDKIKQVAERASIAINIAWNELKLWFIESFGGMLNTIINTFDGMKIKAEATAYAVKMAALDPLHAYETFNNTFDRTIGYLQAGKKESDIFAGSAEATRTNIVNLESALAATFTELDIGTTEDIPAAVTALEDLANTASDTTVPEIEAVGTTATTAATATKTATDAMARHYRTMTNNVSGFFSDLFTNGSSAFGNLANSFKNMLVKMASDFAASKVMKLLGFGGAGAAGGSLLGGLGGGILGGATGGMFGGGGAGGGAGSLIGGALGGGGALAGGFGAVGTAASQFVGGLTGGAFGANAMMPTVFSQAGATLNAALFNPVTAALAGLLVAWKVFGKKSTPSFNAGFMLSPLGIPGEYPIDPFASGIQPAGFVRRAGREQSNAVIESFRAVDSAIVQMFADAGVNFKLSGSGISGYAETGLGQGLFYGAAGEEGKPGVPVDQQLTRYAREMFEKGSNYGLSQEQISSITSAGNYADMLEKGRMVLSGSHKNGLDYVPYDGYIAELHRGERVMTADENRSRDNEISQKLDAMIKILSRSGAEANQQNNEIVQNTYETARQIRDAIIMGNKASVFN